MAMSRPADGKIRRAVAGSARLAVSARALMAND
jgi:hypothetical protein